MNNRPVAANDKQAEELIPPRNQQLLNVFDKAPIATSFVRAYLVAYYFLSFN
jgi:hypothetical protein